VGATHEPGIVDLTPTSAGRAALEVSASKLIGAFQVVGQRAGIRVNLPDKRPIAGRHPDHPRLGLTNGLGAKGALWAPMLAREWVRHLTENAAFDAEVDVCRFVK
jgi:glycine oxidase